MREGGSPAIVLSDAVWTRALGRRFTIVGERITLNDRSYEVVGLMPAGFTYPDRTEFWLPLVPRSVTSGLYYIDFIGRLRPSVSVDQARVALAALRESRKQELPPAALRSEIRAMSLHQRLYGDFRRPLVLLLGTVACVLLIGCANIANLLLARSSTRRAELAVRLAVGASRRASSAGTSMGSITNTTSGSVRAPARTTSRRRARTSASRAWRSRSTRAPLASAARTS